MTFSTAPSLLLMIACSYTPHRILASAQKFDPYQLNGGLVAAVAGRDYVLIASDTRLTDGGFGINSRGYLSGRLWSASSMQSADFSPSSSSSHDVTPTTVAALGSDSIRRIFSTANWEPDGSLAIPLKTEIQRVSNARNSIVLSSPSSTKLPILIGSAGCASDCESLKIRLRSELNALQCTFPSGVTLGVQSVANLLQQVLYGRRGFPFYSFCVVAGIDYRDQGTGAVFVYDAIGSFEQVAVGCAGTGKELLQPILDRLFSESSSEKIDEQSDVDVDLFKRNEASISANEQRRGVAGCLRPPVKTVVECSWEEAINNLAKAYRSVSEREISVGDNIVICLLKTSDINNDSGVEVIRFSLKRH